MWYEITTLGINRRHAATDGANLMLAVGLMLEHCNAWNSTMVRIVNHSAKIDLFERKKELLFYQILKWEENI